MSLTKRILLNGISILAFSGMLSAQFDALPESNARWLVYVFLGPDHIDDFYYRLSNVHADTLINGMDHTKLYGGSFDTNIGALNDNGTGQVFYHDFDTDSSYLLYDFDVQVGDTVYDIFTEQEVMDTVFIVQVDSIEYADKWRKRIGITLSNGISYPGGFWVQGIGAIENGTNGGGIITGCPCSTLSATFRLECVSVRDTIQYGTGEGSQGQCFLLSNIVESDLVPDIPIITTTAPGIFNIETNRSLDIEIFSSTGALVLKTNGHSFDISQQPPGIYIVRLRGKEYVWSQMIVR